MKKFEPKKILARGKHNLVFLFSSIINFLGFTYLLFIYLASKLFSTLAKVRFLPKGLKNFLQNAGTFCLNLGKRRRKQDQGKGRINRINLINLSFKNMMTRKARTLITIGGMSVGIGAIVFLVSLGYGIQALVVHRVARLEELSQAEVNVQPGSLLRINDEVMARIKDIVGVKAVLPMISVVARINYQDSVTDMPVYGVTSEYLEASAIKPSKGQLFASNDLNMAISAVEDKVMTEDELAEAEAVTADDLSQSNKVKVDMDPNIWFPVRESPENDAEVIGYTRRAPGQTLADEVIGDYYYGYTGQKLKDAETGDGLAKWLKGKFLIWQKQSCDPDVATTVEVAGEELASCVDGQYVLAADPTGSQQEAEGYLSQLAMNLEPVAEPGLVLGTSTIDISELLAGSNLDSSNSADLELLAIASVSGSLSGEEVVQEVALHEKAIKQAVVNTAMLEVLGLNEDEAVGKEFNVEFVVTTDLLEEGSSKMESLPAPYQIVGVINEGGTPFFYVPFIDLRTLGITHYSQLKFAVDKDEQLKEARFQVEGLGFATQSVADTVAQIDSLFATVRLLLATLGVIALLVAALGMFNTLTVSLMERTREVGLMKAMGMKSFEVKDLFMTESMIMGLMGGICGVAFGFLAGNLLSLLISARSLTMGLGYISISHIPLMLVLFVVGLSLVVGIFTGYYPAKRATKISALNALRYE